MKPDVTICIPTYQSQAFIGRTLGCARTQTHAAVRILISVDPSNDDTAEVCRRIAVDDRRIDLIEQPLRLGWSQNANALLNLVDTEYYFLYFHDDIIEPTYAERLRRVLLQRPDALSAHCDLVEFGLINEVKPAHEYTGPAFRRLIDFMLTQRGTTLRSMIKRNAASSTIRFPNVYGDSHWAAYVFHMRLLAAGQALAVHEPLYRRWQREGSLTRSEGWEAADLGAVLQGLRDATAPCLELIESTSMTADERTTCVYCLRLFQRIFVRTQQLRIRQFREIENSEFCNAQRSNECRLAEGVLDEEAAVWVLRAENQLKELDREVEALRR
jgi:glycosyltransferase involved in cell wall biosynthesis